MKARKASSPASHGGEDPDIAGIVPGPQPSPWGDLGLDPETDTDDDHETDSDI